MERIRKVAIDESSWSSTDTVDDWPIALVQDRYGGGYSGGAWLAISAADRLENGAYRIVRCLEAGPSDSDIEARAFWADPPSWIAAGASPDEAIQALRARKSGDDERYLAELDRKIAEGTADLDAGRVHTLEEVRLSLHERFGRGADAAE